MRRLVALTCAIVLVDTIFYAALVPLVPYYAERFDLSNTAVGVLNGAFGAGVLLGAAPAGYLASRIGPRAAALWGLGLLSVTSIPFGFAGEAWLLVALRLGEGFGSALSWVAAFTWLVRWYPEEQRGRAIGTLLSAAVVGALLGPVAGGAADVVGIPLVFCAVGALGLAVALWAYLTPGPEPDPVPPPLRSLAAVLRPRLASGLWLILLAPLLFGALVALSPLKLGSFGWSATAIAGVFLAGAAVEAVVHPLLGRWSDRSGYRPPVFAGLLGSVVVLLALPAAGGPSGGPWMLAGLVVLAAAFFNFSLTPGTSLFTEGAEKSGIGQALGFGVTNFAWASGFALGGPLGGLLADLRSETLSYLALIPVCLLTLFLVRRVV